MPDTQQYIAIINKIDETKDHLYGAIESLRKETATVTKSHDSRITTIEAKQSACLKKQDDNEETKKYVRNLVLGIVISAIVLGAGSAVAYAVRAGWTP